MHYNIVILGDFFVGKTSIVNRIMNDSFDITTYSTIGTSYFSKEIKIDNTDKIIKFSLWDTAGQERFRSFITLYLKNAHIIYLCYDITNLDSYNNLKYWMKTIKTYVYNDKYIGFLIGTKCDLKINRMISYNNALNYANELGFFFYETSSKDNTNIETLFEFTIDTFIKKYKDQIRKDEIEDNNKINIKKTNYLQYC